MAFVSFADASRSVDMSDGDLVRFGTSEGGSSGLWSWTTPDGHAVDMGGNNLTFAADGRALTGQITLIQIDVDNDDGLGSPDVRITGLNAPAPVLDDNPVAFWDAVLNGTDIINAQGLSIEGVGASGASYIFGDDFAATLTGSPATIGDSGGNDVITLGTAAAVAVGDIRNITGNVDELFGTYRGGNDQVLGPVTNQTQTLSGDADVVGFFGTLLGGDDLVQTGSSNVTSVAAGDARSAVGISVGRRARVEGGDDEVEGVSGSKATLVGDVHILGGFADVVGGDDTIVDSNVDDGPATRLVGDVFTDQSGGTSTIVGGDDTIQGNGGGDIIVGDVFLTGEISNLIGGNDSLFGGAGNDSIFGETTGEGGAVPEGTSGGDDEIFAGAGADRLYGQTGNDQISGDAGDDTLYGGDGADTLNGGSGFDFASYEGSSGAVDVRLNLGTGARGEASGDVLSRIEGLIGSRFADILKGDANANILQGGDGDDNLSSGGGNDTVYGGRGEDTLNGGGGGDILFGDGGNDVLIGSGGADTLDGGIDRDHASYAGSNAAVDVRLNLGIGSGGHAEGDHLIDVENLTGSTFDDILKGNSDFNELFGGDGNDNISAGGGDDFLAGGAGADVLNGGSGRDGASYVGSPAGVDVRLHLGTGSGGDAEGDVLSNIEALAGSAFDDILKGDSRSNLLFGHAGDDNLSAGGGRDTLEGGAGNDTLRGGGGQDEFVFRARSGSDPAIGHDRIVDFQGGAGVGDVLVLLDIPGIFSFADVQAAAVQSGSDTVIDFGEGNTLTLENFVVSNLAGDDIGIGFT